MNMRNDDSITGAPDTNAESGRSGPSVTLIVFGVIAILAVIFFLQNSERTSIDFLVFEKTTTIRWSIVMAVVFGVLLDRLFTMWWRRRRKKND